MPTLFDTASLGPDRAAVKAALADLAAGQVIDRIWARDHTVWRPDPSEIANRLGWLDIAERIRGALGPVRALVDTVLAEGYTHALLLGMGGSSLAPEVYRRTLGVSTGYLDLALLDSTDPRAVLDRAAWADAGRTLFVVSTKSGGTVETISLFKYFYNRVAVEVGPGAAGSRFIAITDRGSGLDELAKRYYFRATFHGDPNIGGRFSALSPFGLVPAALIGADLDRLLDRAVAAMAECRPSVDTALSTNPGAVLGATLGALARAGRDKLTLVLSPEAAGLGDWIEQLVAESTGKRGTGILPVVGEPLGAPKVYGDDRLFVHIRLAGDTTHDSAVRSLADAGYPVVRMEMADAYDLGRHLFIWEMATAVAASILGVHPFDQPDVDAAKDRARAFVAVYMTTGRLPEPAPVLDCDGITAFGDAAKAATAGEALRAMVDHVPAGGYVALQAYLPPTPAIAAALEALRTVLRDRTRRAVTLGYGPRFLHSTGQLHKGDAGLGRFIQFTTDAAADVPIPDEAGRPDTNLTFGILERAQALGDAEALVALGRRAVRLHLGADAVGGLRKVQDGLRS